MKKWHLKAALQGGMSILPFSQQLNYLFQKYVTRSMKDNRHEFEMRLNMARGHLNFYMRHAGHLPTSILELGSGWRPVVPVSFWLCGIQGTLTSIDIQDLRRGEQMLKTLNSFSAMPPGELYKQLPLLRSDRLETLNRRLGDLDTTSVQQFLTDIGITFIVGDARKTEFKNRQFDHIMSNNTFEHIPGGILGEILQEFRRVLAPDGLMTHFIDLADHYSYFDHSISPYNFLRYSKAQWRWFNNELQYQNRLRINDYRELHTSSGFEIIEEELVTGQKQQLDALTLAPEFARYSREDLGVTYAWLVTRAG